MSFVVCLLFAQFQIKSGERLTKTKENRKESHRQDTHLSTASGRINPKPSTLKTLHLKNHHNCL
jgi:hypothetical protein